MDQPVFRTVRRCFELLAVALLIVAVPRVSHAAPYAYVVNECASISTCGSGNGTASVIDTANNSVVSTITLEPYPYGVAVSPDGSRAYVVNDCASASNCGNGTVSVIDTATKTLLPQIPVGNSASYVAVSPDGTRVYVTNTISPDGTVSVIDTATDSVIATVPAGQQPTGIVVSPDGKRIYVASFGSDKVSVIDAKKLQISNTISLPGLGNMRGIAISPDGRRLYVADEGANGVEAVDTLTGKVVGSISGFTAPWGVAVSPDGSRLYVTDWSSNQVSIIDTATDTVLDRITVGAQPKGISVSPDGSRIYAVNSYDGTVSVIGAATDTVVDTVTVGALPESLGSFVGPGALIAANRTASGSAGIQLSGSVPTLVNATSCTASYAVVEDPARGSIDLDATTGAFTYSPASATYSGPDVFTWRGQAPSNCAAADAPTDPFSNTAAVLLTIDPRLAGLSDLPIQEGKTADEAFSIVGSAPFTHTLASDDATVLPPAGVTVSPPACGADAAHLDCTLAMTAATVPGTAAVTVTAKDKYGDVVRKKVLVTVLASVPSPPSVTGVAPVTVTAPSTATAALALTGTGALTVTAGSSNTALLSDAGITGQSRCTSAGSCSLALAPTIGQSGTTTITVTVTDPYGQHGSASFMLTVNKPAAPTVSGFSNLDLAPGQSGSEALALGGTGTLDVKATSSNTALLPDSGIAGGASCSASGRCTLEIRPAPNQTGTATVTVIVKDAYGQSAKGSFAVSVKSAVSPGGGGGGGASAPVGLLALAGLCVLAALRGRLSRLRGGA